MFTTNGLRMLSHYKMQMVGEVEREGTPTPWSLPWRGWGEEFEIEDLELQRGQDVNDG
jgi:hypothetical protein